MSSSYAVVWSTAVDTGSGRLDALDGGFALQGRKRELSISFTDMTRASIRRGPRDRLRGLPVLVLELARGGSVVIASLEGTAVLHELADRIELTGPAVAA